ncbi:MAG: hypothetical protein K2H49_01485, partial [Muribaculaceae bacterium]|nr:hypothetical protein [Muribaculaceae bacterium]
MKKEQKSLSSNNACKAAKAGCKLTKDKGKKTVNEPAATSGKLLFETSWEVCNKIGGIYTVLSTKARVLKEQFGDNLIFIGPDVWADDNP